MNTKEKTGLSHKNTSYKKDFNFDLTGADFDIVNSEPDEDQDYDIREEDNDNLNFGGDDFYSPSDEG